MLDDEYAEQIGSVEGVVEPMVTAEVERKELEKIFTQVGIRWMTEGEVEMRKGRMERGGRGEVEGGEEAVGEYVWG